MALLENGDLTTNQDATLLIAANTIPGDVVEVYRQGMYMGAARPRDGTPNWEMPVRMPFIGEHTYDVRIRRGSAYSPQSSIVINYVEQLPFLLDTFQGTAGVFIHDHAPDLGATWIRKYDLDNAYEFDDSNYALTGTGGLVQSDFNGSLADRWTWNEVTPLAENYRTRMTFTLDPVSGYLELALFARGDGQDAIRGYVYWGTDGTVQPQVSTISEGNVGVGDSQFVDNYAGEHTLELRVENSVATLRLDGTELQSRTLLASPPAPGTIGFAYRTAGDLPGITVTRIESFAL